MITIPRMFQDYFDNEFYNCRRDSQQCQLAKTDIIETEKEFQITMDLPGFGKENFNIEVTNENVITISGKREQPKSENGEKILLQERGAIEFSRSFKLPRETQHDQVAAAYEDGVLKIAVPKTEKQVPDKIKVTIK